MTTQGEAPKWDESYFRDSEKRIADLTRERDMWKANHDTQVRRKRETHDALTQRIRDLEARAALLDEAARLLVLKAWIKSDKADANVNPQGVADVVNEAVDAVRAALELVAR